MKYITITKMFKFAATSVFGLMFSTVFNPGFSEEQSSAHAADHVDMSDHATPVSHDDAVFSPDPEFSEQAYDSQAQIEIYGGKRAVHTPRPMLELGRPQYQEGPLTRSISVVGERNRLTPALSVFGDFRVANVVNHEPGRASGSHGRGQIAARLNLDIDLKLTATERIHAFVRPLDKNGEFTRLEYSGTDDGSTSSELLLDGNLETLFFEGDLGAILSGFTGKPSSFDMPIAFGLMPLLFQNGVWLEDAFTGVAITIPARNSRALDISNFDITFFAGFDEVSSQAMLGENGKVAEDDVNVYGIASFFETLGGYAEIDYAFIDGQDQFDDLDHHNISLAFTKRYKSIASTSLRIIHTFGQDPIGRAETAGGTLVQFESSLITSKPSTFIPYMNLFAAFDRPQSVARANSGILKNIGINFESDNLSGFPLLDDSGQDVWGGAIGVENLFALNQQLVVEFSSVQLMDEDNPLGKALGDQYALGVRYQRPLSKAWIARFDAMKGWRDNQVDISGVRFEIRRKF